MRFTRKKILIDAYLNNTTKTLTKFLWFPVTIDGETRWLEKATLKLKVKKESNLILGDSYYWVYWEFID